MFSGGAFLNADKWEDQKTEMIGKSLDILNPDMTPIYRRPQ